MWSLWKCPKRTPVSIRCAPQAQPYFDGVAREVLRVEHRVLLVAPRLHAEFVSFFVVERSNELSDLHSDVFHRLLRRAESTARRKRGADLVKLLERRTMHDR